MHIKNIKQYVQYNLERGRRSFTMAEILESLPISSAAALGQLHRLLVSGEIVSPAKGFYVALYPEDRKRGCLSAEDLTPLLMAHWGCEYYVGLLSAARFHGATHQAAQTFYVILEKQRRPVICGAVKIEFIQNKNFPLIPIEQRTVKTGYLAISSIEGTAIDLMHFPRRAGGINHVATVLTELVEGIYSGRLLELAIKSENTRWIQRLGYLLEHIELFEQAARDDCVRALKDFLLMRATRPVLLDPSQPYKSGCIDPVWNVVVNTVVKNDL